MSTEWVEVINAISKLIPVLGGAVIGVIGGLVGTSYAHKLSQKNDVTKEKKSKLEQLVSDVYEIEIWIKKKRVITYMVRRKYWKNPLYQK